MVEKKVVDLEAKCCLEKDEIEKIKYKLYIQNKDVKKIMFTSTKNGEGKSSIILNLAYSITADQKNVLVICYDGADFFKKNLVENQIFKTDISGLDILKINANTEFANFITEGYDYILIETESLENSKKGIELAENVDLVVLVVEANRTRRDAVSQSISELKISSCDNIQVVLNRFKRDYSVMRKRG